MDKTKRKDKINMSEGKNLTEEERKKILKNASLEELREEYLEKRKKERDDLINYLNKKTNEYEDGIKVKAVNSFDGSRRTKDWIGINVIVEDNNNGESAFFISFQPFHLDPKTGNFHTIMNEIGLYLYHDKYLEAYNEAKKITRT